MVEYLHYLAPFLKNLIRYFIWAGIPFLIFYVYFPQTFRLNKIQQRIAQNRDFYREILHSIQTTFIIGLVGVLILKTPFAQYTKIYVDFEEYPIWWLPLSLLLALILHDTYFYWMHRSVHHPKIYRKIHLVHHKSINPSPWTSYSFQWTEGILEAMIAPIILLLIPMHPLAIVAFLLISLSVNIYGHLGFEIAPRWFRHSFLFEVVNTSVYHNIHHEKFVGNYGLYFRIWDRIMKTENPDYVRLYDTIQKRRFGAYTPTLSAKRSLLLLLILLATGLLALQAQSSIVGTWKDHEKGGIIRIYQENGLYYGQLIGADNPADHAKIQGKKIMVIRDFKQENSTTYCCGTLFQPQHQRELSATLILEGTDRICINARYGVFSGTRYLERMY